MNCCKKSMPHSKRSKQQPDEPVQRMKTKQTVEILALLGLWPILLPQALYTHRVTPRLPEPEGARAGQCGDTSLPPLRLLIAGDSAAAGVGVAQQTQALCGQIVNRLANDFNLTWQLIAQSGYTTPEIIERLKHTPAQTFDVAVLSMGANDVTSPRRLSTWLTHQQQLIELLHSRFQVQRIIFSAMPPMHLFPALPQPLRWFLGQRAQNFTAALTTLLHTQPQHHIVPLALLEGEHILATDGFHPGSDTYFYWGEEVAGIIRAWYSPEYR